MAISNYGELKTQLGTYLFHQRFVAQYDNATLKFERVCNRKLRVRQTEKVTTPTFVAGSATLPTDYLKWRTLLYTAVTPYVDLDYVHPRYLRSTVAGNDPGNPRIFTIEGEFIKVRPTTATSSAYEFHYHQKLSTITASDDTTNWLLTDHPDAYEYGVLVELFALARNREAAELYKLRRDEVLAEITQLSSLTTDPSSPLVRTGEYF